MITPASPWWAVDTPTQDPLGSVRSSQDSLIHADATIVKITESATRVCDETVSTQLRMHGLSRVGDLPNQGVFPKN